MVFTFTFTFFLPDFGISAALTHSFVLHLVKALLHNMQFKEQQHWFHLDLVKKQIIRLHPRPIKPEPAFQKEILVYITAREAVV